MVASDTFSDGFNLFRIVPSVSLLFPSMTKLMMTVSCSYTISMAKCAIWAIIPLVTAFRLKLVIALSFALCNYKPQSQSLVVYNTQIACTLSHNYMLLIIQIIFN